MIIDGTNGAYAAHPNTLIATPINIYGADNMCAFNITSSGTSSSPGSTIRGLVINNCGWEAIKVEGDYNTVAGCYIGTDVDGGTAVPNGRTGWSHGLLLDGNNNTIGGTTTADRNIISGNARGGVWVWGDNDTIQGNYIGVTSNGYTELGNGWVGVGAGNIAENTLFSGNVICGNGFTNTMYGLKGNGILLEGGTTTVVGNIISGNNQAGIWLSGSNYTGNQIVRNSIYGNGQLGISLGAASPISNDNGDIDAGPNNLQNFPVLSTAVINGTQLILKGGLNSTANTSFRIEFFANSISVGP